MAFLERKNTTQYDNYIGQELRRLGHGDEKVLAHASARLPVDASQWLLLGGAAGATAQSCIIAVTGQSLLLILTEQIFIETPKVVQSFIYPLEKVKLLESKQGWFENSLTLSIDGNHTKLHILKLPGWTDFAALETLLAQR